MKTRVYPSSQENVKRLALFLHQSDVVGFPTETVYGLGAVWDDDEAVQKIYHLKKRAKDKSFSIHICDINQVQEVAVDVPDIFYQLAQHFFPGPLTMIVPKNPNVSSYVSSNDKVAIRFPNHLDALALIRAVGRPIIGTSANISGQIPSVSAVEVLQKFDGQIAAILDGGPCRDQKPSTIIDLVEHQVLRWGSITLQEIKPFLSKTFFI